MRLSEAYLKAKEGDTIKSKTFVYGYKKKTLDDYLKKGAYDCGQFTFHHIMTDDWEIINSEKTEI